MPALVTVAGAQTPITPADTPAPPSDPQAGSKLDQAYAAGTARDPAQLAYANHTPGAPWPIGVASPPELRVPGVPRGPLGHLAALTDRTPWAPDAWLDNPRGQKVAQAAGAATPPAGQLPSPAPTGNTWRAEPKPWDAAYYVGAQQA